MNNHTLPLVFNLLTRKTEAIYARALTELKEINPCLSPTVITVDFETASINAFSKVFPGKEPKGCFFHFAQANWRKLQELGLSTLYQKDETIRETVKCLVSLALIPPSDIYLGFEKVIEEGQEDLMPFFEYFETTFERLGSSGRLGRRSTPLFHHGLWNQYDAAANGGQKTNNAVEGRHHAFQSGMGFSHPTILKFLHYLKREQSLTENKIARIRSGEKFKKDAKYEASSERLMEILANYQNNRIKKTLIGISCNFNF